MVVGFVGAAPGGIGLARNAAAICAGGSIVGIYRNRALPNYGVFDEKRWFSPGDGPPTMYRHRRGMAVGVSICEDVWSADGPVVAARPGVGPIWWWNINASPFSHGRWVERLAMLSLIGLASGLRACLREPGWGPGRAGVRRGQRGVGSEYGSLLAAGPQFAEDLVVVDVVADSNNGPASPFRGLAVKSR